MINRTGFSPSSVPDLYHSKFQTCKRIFLIGATITAVALAIIFGEPLILIAAAIPLAIYIYDRYKKITHLKNQSNSIEPNPSRSNTAQKNIGKPRPSHSTPEIIENLKYRELYQKAEALTNLCLQNEIFKEGNSSIECELIKNKLIEIGNLFELRIEIQPPGLFNITEPSEDNRSIDLKKVKNSLLLCLMELKNIEEYESEEDIFNSKAQLHNLIKNLPQQISRPNPKSSIKTNTVELDLDPQESEFLDKFNQLVHELKEEITSHDNLDSTFLVVEHQLENIAELFHLKIEKPSSDLFELISTKEEHNPFVNLEEIKEALTECFEALQQAKNDDNDWDNLDQRWEDLNIAIQTLTEAMESPIFKREAEITI